MRSLRRWLVIAGISIIISGGLAWIVNENGFSQVKSPINIQQPAQKKRPDNKSTFNPGQAQIPGVVAPTPTPTPTPVETPLSFTLKPNKTEPYQGEKVTFILSPAPRPGYPYSFLLHFEDDHKAKTIEYVADRDTVYRFLTPGKH